MSEIIINGQVYKEKKIKNLVVNGTPQSSIILSADQLKGQDKLHVNIETEPTVETPKVQSKENPE
ncbi:MULTISPECIES: hypothetical protein [Clostridium]|uniref:Uncharacterized protein n=1 Tax=Clostridium aquiflavi TaxID=3073603 RepID=A0ABU1ECK1_9CLOT|nr:MULTISPECIES: hypothetical protein [unclassified Clostridium]MDR5585908.1 hypothetical protein [Clostridium sp. 5N-1]NFG60908.1 hypothetical protein [Clostridium botulinum]NFQ09507.1 hypothetical protein [Clostridium botulinum]